MKTDQSLAKILLNIMSKRYCHYGVFSNLMQYDTRQKYIF